MAPADESSMHSGHEVRGLPTLFRGGDDQIANSKPGAISANLDAPFSPPARQLPNPATIRNSTLLFPAIPKNAPCSLSSGGSY
jgi:hypothetical protein